ncbi:ATP-dependent helicase, putative [Plasmodium gallinaceum]|uniref:RNA helicase n=1 Tax=Plasmodium gallinaceum TaxID=5849 RepID=A0A1J1GZ32_PLAGA|nr:ATP-dependent helicase, putative [Plasmodium gallinaceum]CRG97821.1 ATP-dependent helicase, putative [Plasmodium gallinaceum]
MRSLFCNILNHVGIKLKIYITLSFLLLYLNICICKTNKILTFRSINNNFFIYQNNVNFLKKQFLLRKINEKQNKSSIYLNHETNDKTNNNGEIYNNIDHIKRDSINDVDNIKYYEKPNDDNIIDDKEKKKIESTNDKNEFSHFDEINKNIVNYLESKGIKYMTKIQSQSFNPIYNGKDIIGRSETGSGKTLAFALPLVEKLHKMKTEKVKNEITEGDEEYKFESKNPVILVLEPTRELSKQVENTFKEISQFYNFNIISIYGGENYTYQEKRLRKGIDILTGTPGRIIDHIERKNLSLKNIKFLVLDEADEMLNLGFTHDIERILSHINLKEAQILLYSATTPSWIKDISSKYLKNPFCIDVVDSFNKTSKNINHIAIKTPYDIKEKALLLEDLILVKSNGGQVIIFTRTKLEADILCSEGSFKSLTFSVLHGNIAQSTREYTMQRFRQGMFQILIATDIASRGLDISNVDLVIQCFPPNYSSIYIHRAGRTGRANKKGTSLVLFSNEDKHDLLKIEKSCGIKFNIETLPSNEDVFLCASNLASKRIDSVNKNVLPFFHKTAQDIINKCNSTQIDQIELISRCLAVITKKDHIKKRSLISGLSETITLCFINKSRKWRNEDDIIYWINKISSELNVNTFNKVLQVKIDNKDRSSSFFDLNENLAQLLIQNFKSMSKNEYRKILDLFVAQKIPEYINLSSEETFRRYQNNKKSYSYRKRRHY